MIKFSDILLESPEKIKCNHCGWSWKKSEGGKTPNVCNKCGLIASYNEQLHIHCCNTCENRVDFSYVEIPYACKLLFQELTTMNVVPRIMTEH